MSFVGREPIKITQLKEGLNCLKEKKKEEKTYFIFKAKDSSKEWEIILVINNKEKSQTLSPKVSLRLVDKNMFVFAEPKALWGTMQRKLKAKIEGMQRPHKYVLEMVGVGYRAQKIGENLELFVGYSHSVKLHIPSALQVEVSNNGTEITVEGEEKEEVSSFVSLVKRVRKKDPYKGKGIHGKAGSTNKVNERPLLKKPKK